MWLVLNKTLISEIIFMPLLFFVLPNGLEVMPIWLGKKTAHVISGPHGLGWAHTLSQTRAGFRPGLKFDSLTQNRPKHQQ